MAATPYYMKKYDIPATCYFTLFSLSLDANRLDASNGLDDAACSRDVEEVVAAGLQTCCANVCMTHVRTAARSHTHCDQLSNASAAHFVREDEDPCKMTYSRMALIERDLSATTQMQMHSQMGFSCSNRRAARQRQASGAAHTQHGGARLARAYVTETPQAESRATGGARLLAQTTAAQLRMLITTTRWTGPTCCWKTVAMAGEWTAAGTATGRAVLMVPVGAVAMRRRAGGCSWRSRGSREPRDGLRHAWRRRCRAHDHNRSTTTEVQQPKY